MRGIRTDLVEVFVFRRHRRRTEFLVLKRSARGSLPQVWQPVTGRLRRGESVLAGARREVREETGLEPRRWWALESMTVYFDPRSASVVLLPVLAAEVSIFERVRISREHQDHAFVPARTAARRFLWIQQREALDALRREVLAGGRRARALAITHLMRAAVRPASPGTRRRAR